MPPIYIAPAEADERFYLEKSAEVTLRMVYIQLHTYTVHKAFIYVKEVVYENTY